MKKLLALLALAVTTACAGIIVPPKPPVPPPTKVQTVAVTLSPTVTGCSIHLETADPTSPPYEVDGQSPFTQVPWAIQTIKASTQCDGMLAASATVPTAGDGNTQITLTQTPLAPKPPPLPPVPTREQLALVHPCFQGCAVTLTDGTTVPSWGPEVGQESAADRQLTYAAHKKAGATHFVIGIICHYNEPGVAYPGGDACKNDWRTDPAMFQTIVTEIIRAGLYPTIALGGDELPFPEISASVGQWWGWLASAPAGDLRPYCVPFAGFDSVVPVGNANDDAVQQMLDMMLAIRAAIGPQGVQAFELPNGWAFFGPTDARFNLAGAGSYSSAAGQAVDVWLQEFNSPPGPPGPAPAIVAGTWDAEHNDYAPVFADPNRAVSFMQIWQVGARTVRQWTRPFDEPTPSHCTTVPVTGGPQAGGTACVYVDSEVPPKYDTGQTPRGRTYWIAFELATYSWTHGFSMSAADIKAAGPYFTSAGWDVAAVPVTLPTTLVLSRRLRF